MSKVSIVISASSWCCSVRCRLRTAESDELFRHECGFRDGREPRWVGGGRQALPDTCNGAGAGSRTWRAYLSTQGTGAVNARDRIGKGPWRNAKGVVIAQSTDDLHSAKANLTKDTILTEKGQPVKGRGDTPNEHDMLTGSQMNGSAFTDSMDHTCNNWTSGSTGGAQVGHSDRMGLTDTEQAKSWNSSHPSKGCSQENLVSTGGAGLFYCFAGN